MWHAFWPLSLWKSRVSPGVYKWGCIVLDTVRRAIAEPFPFYTSVHKIDFSADDPPLKTPQPLVGLGKDRNNKERSILCQVWIKGRVARTR